MAFNTCYSFFWSCIAIFFVVALFAQVALAGPDNFSSCNWNSETKVLDCSNRGFTLIPEAINTEYPDVKVINFQDNSILFSFANAFSELKELIELNLGGNSLSAISAGFFNGLDALKIINLSHNNIETLNEDTFTALSNLEEIYLANNALTTLPEGIFFGLSELRIVTLEGNLFGSIAPPSTFGSGESPQPCHHACTICDFGGSTCFASTTSILPCNPYAPDVECNGCYVGVVIPSYLQPLAGRRREPLDAAIQAYCNENGPDGYEYVTHSAYCEFQETFFGTENCDAAMECGDSDPSALFCMYARADD